MPLGRCAFFGLLLFASCVNRALASGTVVELQGPSTAVAADGESVARIDVAFLTDAVEVLADGIGNENGLALKALAQ